MLLHIGADKSISKEQIIVILDQKTIKKSSINSEFLKKSKKELIMDVQQTEDVKSVIITEEKIYLSAISSTTLKKRFAQLKLQLG